jgi:hypothetical protein
MFIGRHPLWQALPAQDVSSRDTCVNILPRLFKRCRFAPGTVNADLGGGRFDTATAWLASLGVENLVWDPHWRSLGHNAAVAARVSGGRADTATVANVLNVIREADARAHVVALAADAVGTRGVAYFQVYEGDGTGAGRRTARGWQENRPLASYLDEIARHFRRVEAAAGIVAARNPLQ